MKLMLPTEIPIMGQIVKISYQEELDLDGEELAGACMAGDNLIMISTTEHETEKEILKTLGHELVHFVWAKSGLTHILGEHEEPCTVSIEENLLPLFRFDRRRWRKKIEVTIGNQD